MDNKKKVQKYMTLYMSMGIPIGMCLGMAVGAAKDKRLSENMMKVSRIEAVQGSSDILIYAIDKNGAEKAYRVSAKKMKEEKITVGDRVDEDKEGSLVSLER